MRTYEKLGAIRERRKHGLLDPGSVWGMNRACLTTDTLLASAPCLLSRRLLTRRLLTHLARLLPASGRLLGLLLLVKLCQRLACFLETLLALLLQNVLFHLLPDALRAGFPDNAGNEKADG
jgi:hypothetical protein